jgi:hypothetical protein
MQGEFPMKKVLVVPLFAIAAVVSHVWAQEHCKNSSGTPLYCQWSTGCFSINNQYEPNIGKACSDLIASCEKDGSTFTGVPSSALTSANGYGEGVDCLTVGGTWAGGGKDPNAASLGWCDWGPCVFKPGDDYSCEEGGCFEIKDETQLSDCENYATKLTSKTQCPTTSLPKADGGTGGTPIVSGASKAGLTVLAQNGSLYISSLRDVSVSLFDMNGKQVLNEKLPKGYNPLSLSGQKQGVYFAVVSSGSSKQTVRVVLK